MSLAITILNTEAELSREPAAMAPGYTRCCPLNASRTSLRPSNLLKRR